MRRLKGAVLSIVAAGSLAASGVAGAAAADVTTMPAAEIRALQTRLTDDGCYSGPIDGEASAATQDAIKACPDQDPVLRIETGMHVAAIKRIGVDAACSLIVTGSDDKTVRVWSLPDGHLRRTIRLPIGPGNGGKIDSVALSPDGRTLAAGGWDAAYDKDESRGDGVYVVDLATGDVRRLGGFENVANQLAFSADGTRIAVGSGPSSGVHVLDRESGRELMSGSGYNGEVYGLSFGPDGSLVTTGMDGYLRRYAPDLRLTAKVKAPGGSKPYQVSFSFDGRRVAVGYDDAPSVSIHDATTLKPILKGQTMDLPGGDLANVIFAPSGQFLAGGNEQVRVAGQWKRFLRRFGPDGRRVDTDLPLSGNRVTDLQTCGGGIAYSAGDPLFGLLNGGKAHTLQGPVATDMRDKLGDSFTVSADAATVRFGLLQSAQHPVVFDLAAGSLSESPDPVDGLTPPPLDGLTVTDWEDNVAPKLNGKPLAIERYDISRSVAVRPDHSGFVLGSSFWLRAFDAQGKERWHQLVPGEAWGANFSADGRIVVAAYGDGTLRWHRWSDGKELLALFVNAEDRRWVAWTPTGYYMASPGAEDMIGWHVNRGWEQLADFFPASRFRAKFARPDIVRRVLKTLDEGEAIRQADAAANKHDDKKPLIESLPPVLNITAPAEGATIPPGPVEVHYDVRLPSGGAVDRVEAFVDGAKVEARGGNGAAGTVSLLMPAHDATLSLVAYAGGKASDAVRLDLKTEAVSAGTPPSADTDALKPDLYALLIGVTHYANPSLDLVYPAADATDLGQALKAQEGRLYRHVTVKVLTDKDATLSGIRDGLAWLASQATSRDVAIVFEAGHGVTDARGKFWFASYNVDPQHLFATAFSSEELEDTFFALPGKKLMFVDACHAGSALEAGARGLERTDMSAAVNDVAQAEGGVVAFAASTGKELSLERNDWGHGAFTKALIEGLDGRADLMHTGTITTATLDAFVAQRVKELTGGAQHPEMTRPKTVPDFAIAAVK